MSRCDPVSTRSSSLTANFLLRSHRKMQKQVYRVRTQGQIRARLALDMWREAQSVGRQQTLISLHHARAG